MKNKNRMYIKNNDVHIWFLDENIKSYSFYIRSNALKYISYV